MTIDKYFRKLSKERRVDIKALLVIGIVSFLYSLPIFSQGFIQGHDSVLQLSTIASRIEALREGQFPLRWAGDLNHGYGNPSFVVYYPLGGYLVSILYFLGVSLEASYEVLLAVSFISAPLLFYLWAKYLFKKEVALVSSLFYGLSPYLFLDTYVRAHLGETISLSLIPLVLFFLERNLKKTTIVNIAAGGLVYSLFLQAHGIFGLIFSIVFILYIFIRSANIRSSLVSLLIPFLGFTISAYFWIPAFIESKYINSPLFLNDWYKSHFIPFKDLVYSAWGFGDSIREEDGLSAQVGPVHFLFFLLSIGMLLKAKVDKKILIFWIALFGVAVFLSTSVSAPIWEKIHVIQKFQFPWRLTALSVLSSSVISGYVFSFLNKRWVILFSTVLLMFLAVQMAVVPRSQTLGDKYYFNYSGSGSFHNEATTIWVEGDPHEYPKEKIEIIGGQGEIKNVSRKSNVHTFLTYGKTDIQILDNTIYFPGWKAYVDGKKVPIEFQDPNHRGLITFHVPKGNHGVEVKFGESPIRLLSDIISLVGIIVFVFIIVFRKWLENYLQKIIS